MCSVNYWYYLCHTGTHNNDRKILSSFANIRSVCEYDDKMLVKVVCVGVMRLMMMILMMILMMISLSFPMMIPITFTSMILSRNFRWLYARLVRAISNSQADSVFDSFWSAITLTSRFASCNQSQILMQFVIFFQTNFVSAVCAYSFFEYWVHRSPLVHDANTGRRCIAMFLIDRNRSIDPSHFRVAAYFSHQTHISLTAVLTPNPM